MRVGVALKAKAYTPEAYAYKEYLEKRFVEVQLASELQLDPFNDINIYFMGVRPFWRAKKSRAFEIHEYQSLSTPPYGRIKDLIKKRINGVPDGRIFLNEFVSGELSFSDAVPYVLRDMGVDDVLFQRPSSNPVYDVVYCGSIEGRKGLLTEVKRLASIGFSVLVVGDVSVDVRKEFSVNKSVHFTGRVDRQEIGGLYRECRAGLNYTPDMYPYNLQTSTKTLEYLASGLQVISNRYSWAERFFFELCISDSIVWLDSINKREDAFKAQCVCPDIIRKFSWDNILDKCRFYEYLSSFC